MEKIHSFPAALTTHQPVSSAWTTLEDSLKQISSVLVNLHVRKVMNTMTAGSQQNQDSDVKDAREEARTECSPCPPVYS